MKTIKHLIINQDFNLKLKPLIKKNQSSGSKIQLAKYLNIGYYLITPIIIGLFGGIFLDNLLKTGKIFFIIFFSVGIIATFYNLFKIYKDD